jgi:Kef-type K+ transport system membrane component KefB
MKRLIVIAVALWPALLFAAGTSDGHGDPVAPLALSLLLVLTAAKLGGELAVRLRQPAVLGELLAGVFLGNLPLLGITQLQHLWGHPTLDMLARLGVLLLLFEVGLESTVGQLMKVGASSLLVATLGVIAPFALGWLVSAWFLPHIGTYGHAFVGATLCATSVGITARVLQDLGRLQTRESRIILGAAVIDDVMGLLVLAVVSGAIGALSQGTRFSYASVGVIALKAIAFLAGALLIGVFLSPRIFRIATRLRVRGVLLALGLSWCLLLAWLANWIGLAPIVGAFAAGLILEHQHEQVFVERGEQALADLIRPISSFLAPVFFVLMGIGTDLRSFATPSVLGLALVLTAAAVIGKQACSLGVWGGVDRLSIGIGMIPRGEVGLIFANIGLQLQLGGRPVIDRTTFSAIVAMVVLTTLLTPFALKYSLAHHEARAARAAGR